MKKNKTAKRRELVESAISVFMKKGTITMNDIAHEIGIGQNAIFKKAHSKNNILLMVYDCFWDRMLTEITTLIKNPMFVSPVSKLENMFLIFFVFVVREKNLICTVSNNKMPNRDDEKFGEVDFDKIIEKQFEFFRLFDGIIIESQNRGEIIDSVQMKPQIIRQFMTGFFLMILHDLLLATDDDRLTDITYQDAKSGYSTFMNRLKIKA